MNLNSMTKKQLIEEIRRLNSLLDERNQTETKLRESEAALLNDSEQLSQIFKNTPLPYQSLDENGYYLDVNQTFEDVLGYSKEEIIGKNFADIIHPHSLDRFNTNFLKFKTIGEIHDAELELFKKNGASISIKLEGKIQQEENGRFKKTHCIFEDISGRKEAEKTLRASESRFRTLFNDLGNAVFVTKAEGDDKGRILEVNPAAELQTGYSRQELIGMNIVKDLALTGSANISIEEWDERVLKGEKSTAIEKKRKKNGSEYWTDVIITPIEYMGEKSALSINHDITERIKAETELKRNINFTTALLYAIPTPVFYKDKEGRYLGCNNAFTEIMGITPEEIRGKTVQELWPSKQAEMYHQKDLELINNPENQVYEFEVTDKDGNIRPTIFAKDVFRDEDGSVAGLVGAFLDITDRKQAEEARKESERRLSTLMNNLPGIAYRCKNDKNWTMLFISNGCYKLTGYQASELIFNKLKSYDDLIISSDKEMVWEKVQQGIEGKCAYEIEYKIITKDGDEKFVWEKGTPVFEGSELKFLEGFIADITERKIAEKTLQESEEKYRHLIQNSADAIYLLYNRRFEIINEKFSELFGVTLDEINKPGFDFIDLVAPQSRQLVEERIKRQAKGEKLEPKYEFIALNAEGKEIEIETSVSHVKYKDGIATQGILRDITERKRLENQLHQSQKMEAIGQLAGGVAHDFNNLLTVINGRCEMLLFKDIPEKIENSIIEIKNAGEKAARLTAQLLAFSRKQVIQPKTINLNSLITNIIKMLRRLLGEDMEISLRLFPDLANIKADLGQMEQIITNIAINARDAMPYGGKLTIETMNVEFDEDYVKNHSGSKPGKFVMLALTDTGVGMNNDTQEHIFEPFFTTKERDKGTGLGLATVYGIVKQNNGFIYVYSELQKGTTFKIYLPQLFDPKTEREEKAVDHSVYRGNETILLVEDDDGVRDITNSTLSEYGYTVLTAVNGEEAVRIFAEHKNSIDLLLTDVVMPVMSGRELAEKLLAEEPSLKVLYFSGYTDNSIVHHGVLEEGMEFIQKPFSHVELSKKIRNVLNK